MRPMMPMVLLAITILLPTPTTVLAHGRDGVSQSHSSRADAARVWVCNAYGRGGTRGTWHTVSGARMKSEAAAKTSAMHECRSRFTGCQPSGCWPY